VSSASAGGLSVARQPAAPHTSDARLIELAHRARRLSWISLIWMGAEGSIAVVAGILAGSIALVGFGLDSAIEGFASVAIVWRFSNSRMFSQRAEDRAQKIVAVQFFLLAPYVAFESVRALLSGEHPEVSYLGMALAATSVVGMPLLGVAKQRISRELGSSALKGEGNQNLLCAYLAGALLVGLIGNALFGAWWLDPAVGLFIAVVAVREGIDTLRGDSCCALPGISAAGSSESSCRD